MTLEQVKNYLRISFNDDDSYLESLIKVADGYLEDGITNYKEKLKNERFKTKAEMVQYTIIQNLYDERYMMGQTLEMNYIIRSMIHQLEYGEYNV
ncbi:head-tail connector protein [Peptoniphilus asaccharolyticus]